MMEAHNNNAIYYIYKYTYNAVKRIVEEHHIRYDNTLDMFIDENGEYYTYFMDSDGCNVHKKPKEKTI